MVTAVPPSAADEVTPAIPVSEQAEIASAKTVLRSFAVFLNFICVTPFLILFNPGSVSTAHVAERLKTDAVKLQIKVIAV